VHNQLIQTSLQARYGQHSNLLKMKVNLACIEIFPSYRAVATNPLGCKSQWVNSVWGVNLCLF